MRIAAAATYALHPAAIVSASTLLSEALFTFLLACGVVLVIAARRSDRLLLSGAGGVVMAVAILCRPIAMLYVFCSIVVLLFWRRQARAASHAVVLLAGCALTILPWTVRCTAVTGRLVIAQAAGITNWYLPTRWDLDQSDQVTLWREFNNDPYGRRLNAARTPAEIAATSRFGAEQALRNVRANPGAYIAARIRTYPHLFVSSFGATIGVDRTLGAVVAERDFGTVLLLAGFLLVFSILPLAAAAAGVCRAVRDPAGALCVALVVATLLVHIPMWIEYRYWLPVLPYELALAAAGASVIAGARRRPAPFASVD
jgi:4-amino-4-deoxy-L-arabinose transferase-like glycosyltransferase